MMNKFNNYDLFFKFIDAHVDNGFTDIKPEDPLMIELEEMMERNNQFIYVADLIKISIIFSSKHSRQLLGVAPEILSFYHFYEATHPEDLKRNSLARATILKIAHELYQEERGHKLMSTTTRVRNPNGVYSNLLQQMYLFFSPIPYKTVFMLKVHTTIDWCKNPKDCYHYYLGEDLTNFKYPDQEMLKIGKVFSERELEIIRLIGKGYTSEQIAEKLFLSRHTVNTHRRNMLHKTGMATMSELIFDLMERGLL